MRALGVVLDTNVVVAGLKSKRGASNAILESVYSGEIELHLSVPLVLEYEEVLGRAEFAIPQAVLAKVVDDLCAIGVHHEVHFLWRPFLRDPDDDFLLELALQSGCDYLVTHNVRDFEGIDKLGIAVITPKEFLNILRNSSNE